MTDLLCFYRTYGSGYPGQSSTRGTADRGFPFYFWPVSFGVGGAGGAAYLYNNHVSEDMFLLVHRLDS